MYLRITSSYNNKSFALLCPPYWINPSALKIYISINLPRWYFFLSFLTAVLCSTHQYFGFTPETWRKHQLSLQRQGHKFQAAWTVAMRWCGGFLSNVNIHRVRSSLNCDGERQTFRVCLGTLQFLC